MKRPASGEKNLERIARWREMCPELVIRSTFIAGFPGETDAEFAELEGFVRDTGFDHIGVFTYSHEEGTRAFTVADDVPAATKRKRRDRVMKLQQGIVAARQRQRIGTEVAVLLDGPSAEHELVLQGRLEGQAPDIDPLVYLTDCDPSAYVPGQLINARIVGARGYDLIASPWPSA
jgi:ribosomal protein S12 methylthiotransferase